MSVTVTAAVFLVILTVLHVNELCGCPDVIGCHLLVRLLKIVIGARRADAVQSQRTAGAHLLETTTKLGIIITLDALEGSLE